MRTIKFRGKDENNKWWYGGYYNLPDGKEGVIHRIAVNNCTNEKFEFHDVVINPATVGQFTGLTDKNDKEVYEGDIATDGLSLYTVEFSEESCSFVWHRHGSYNTYHFEKTDTEEMEIIGNIHDNFNILQQ